LYPRDLLRTPPQCVLPFILSQQLIISTSQDTMEVCDTRLLAKTKQVHQKYPNPGIGDGQAQHHRCFRAGKAKEE
jgi:hypothetical protein